MFRLLGELLRQNNLIMQVGLKEWNVILTVAALFCGFQTIYMIMGSNII